MGGKTRRRSQVSSCCGALCEEVLAEGFPSDFIGPVGVGVEPGKGCVHIGQILFDGVKVEGALMWVHAFIVGDRALVASME